MGETVKTYVTAFSLAALASAIVHVFGALIGFHADFLAGWVGCIVYGATARREWLS